MTSGFFIGEIYDPTVHNVGAVRGPQLIEPMTNTATSPYTSHPPEQRGQQGTPVRLRECDVNGQVRGDVI